MSIVACPYGCSWRIAEADDEDGEALQAHCDSHEERGDSLPEFAPGDQPEVDALEPEPEPEPEGRIRHRGTFAPVWDEEKVTAAIREFHSLHGRPPMQTDCRGNPALPSPSTVRNVCGSWANAVERAGFPRPRRGGGKQVIAREKKRELATAKPNGKRGHGGPPTLLELAAAVEYTRDLRNRAQAQYEETLDLLRAAVEHEQDSLGGH